MVLSELGRRLEPDRKSSLRDFSGALDAKADEVIGKVEGLQEKVAILACMALRAERRTTAWGGQVARIVPERLRRT